MIPIHDISEASKKDVLMNQLSTLNNYDASEPHRHNYFEFFVFEKGGGVHLIDFVEFPIESNSIHVVAPGQVHQVKRELDSNGFVFLFELNSFDGLKHIEDFLMDHICLEVQEFSPTYKFEVEFETDIQSVVKKAWRTYCEKGMFNMQLVVNQLSELMLYCMRLNKDHLKFDDIKTKNIYTSFRRLLNQHFKTTKKVSEYASLMHISEKQLNDIIYSRTGENVSTLIYKQLVLEAKRLLNTGLTSKEISYELNFIDPGHFSKFFKNQTGYSPTEFIKIHE